MGGQSGVVDALHLVVVGQHRRESHRVVVVALHPHVERFFLATGRLLPIWNLLGEDAQVRRLITQDGRSLLGRIVPVEAVNALLDKLGLGANIQLTVSEIVSAAMAGKVVPINAARGRKNCSTRFASRRARPAWARCTPLRHDRLRCGAVSRPIGIINQPKRTRL